MPEAGFVNESQRVLGADAGFRDAAHGDSELTSLSTTTAVTN